MPMRHLYADNGSLLVCYYFGIVELNEVLENGKRAYLAPEFHPDMDRLHIFHDSVDAPSMDVEALHKVRAMQAAAGATSPIGHKNIRQALVIRNELQGSIMKLYGALWNLDPSSKVEIAPFYTLADSLSWLGRPDLALPSFTEVFEQYIW